MFFDQLARYLKQIIGNQNQQNELIQQLKEVMLQSKEVILQIATSGRQPVEEEWLDVHDLMRIFKKSDTTIYQWTKNNQLECITLGGSHFYLKSDVFALKNKRGR
jgi:hypothetical protein